MLRTGFIGAGRRATSAHYPSLHRIDEISLEAVAELDEGRLLAVTEQYNVPRRFIDYQEMLNEVELDAVCVVMSDTLVTPIALECMAAGKHVFIEKPPGANSAESQLLLDAAEANSVSCMVGYQRRYAAVTREAMRLVDAQGPPTLAIGEFHKNLLGEEPPETGTLWQDICHVVDLVRFMAGSEPVEVTAYQDAHGTTWPNSYNGLIRFANDAVGIVTGNRASGGGSSGRSFTAWASGATCAFPTRSRCSRTTGSPGSWRRRSCATSRPRTPWTSTARRQCTATSPSASARASPPPATYAT